MISIITAVHNQLKMNELFVHSLKENTHNPYELIIVDNNSTDGSREFFEQNGAIVIRNNANYSYPHCQNQGIKRASHNVLAFFNNDIMLPPDWDVHLLNVIGKNGCEVVSFATNDRGANRRETQISRRWKRIKYPVLAVLGVSNFSLRLMFWLMYRNWKKFTKKKLIRYGYAMSKGFSGAVIAMTREGLNKIGEWDERMQGADFDICARCLQRHETVGDMQPLNIISGVYIHHYGRLTARNGTKTPFADAQNLISLEQKWGNEVCNSIFEYIRQ